MANYLYNGVELPALPDWDKEVYPYAWIDTVTMTRATHELWLVKDVDLTAFSASGTTSKKNYFKMYECLVADGVVPTEWTLYTSKEEMDSASTVSCTRTIWTNTDMSYSDGTLILAASEPVPVREYPIASEVTLSPQSVEVTAGQAQDIQFTLTGTDGTDYTGIATWAYAITDKNGTVSKDDAPWVSWVSAEDGSVLLRITADAPGGHEITVIAAWGTEDDPQNLWAKVTIPVKRVSEQWLYSFQTGLALGLCGSALDIHSAPPAYIWDEESGMLIVNRDEGSLIYDFNRNTFHLNVTQQY